MPRMRICLAVERGLPSLGIRLVAAPACATLATVCAVVRIVQAEAVKIARNRILTEPATCVCMFWLLGSASLRLRLIASSVAAHLYALYNLGLHNHLLAKTLHSGFQYGE